MCGPAHYPRHQGPKRYRRTLHANPLADHDIALFLLVHTQHDPIEGGLDCGRLLGQFLLIAKIGHNLVRTLFQTTSGFASQPRRGADRRAFATDPLSDSRTLTSGQAAEEHHGQTCRGCGPSPNYQSALSLNN